MSGTAWFYTLWLMVDLVMFIVGCMMIVIGALRREGEHRTMYGEVTRRLIGENQERRTRRAKARAQVDLEADMADIRAERERARL